MNYNDKQYITEYELRLEVKVEQLGIALGHWKNKAGQLIEALKEIAENDYHAETCRDISLAALELVQVGEE